MRAFDAEVWYGDRVAVLGSNGSGKSHFLRLLARGGSDPCCRPRPCHDDRRAGQRGRAHRHGDSRCTRRAGAVRADPCAPGVRRAHAAGDPAPRRRSSCGDASGCRGSALDRYGLVRQAQQTFDSLSGGQQSAVPGAVCSNSPGRRCCCGRAGPTTWTWSPPRRWSRPWRGSRGRCWRSPTTRRFARSFDRFLVFGSDGDVYESGEPVWEREAGGSCALTARVQDAGWLPSSDPSPARRRPTAG